MTRPATDIRCVVFDLGGVLVRICRSWQEACAAAGLPVHADISGEEQTAKRRAVSAQYEMGKMGCDEFFASIAATTQGLYDAEQFRAIHEAWVLGEYPRVHQVIDALHAAELATGVLSNTNHSHWEDSRLHIARRTRHPHASHLLGVAKPDLEIYRAFERATALAPEHILFFDDLPQNIRGAKAAGWHARHIDHTGDTAEQMFGHLRALGLLR